MCVLHCVHGCIHVQMCSLMQAHVHASCRSSDTLHQPLTEPEVYFRLERLGSKTPGSPCVHCSPMLELQACTALSNFYVGFGDQNSDSCACYHFGHLPSQVMDFFSRIFQKPGVSWHKL